MANSPTSNNKFYSQELPPYIIKLIKTKRRMYRAYRNNPDPKTKTLINDYNKNIHRMIQQYRTHKWLHTCSNINQKQGRNFYQEVKKLSRYKKLSLQHCVSQRLQMIMRKFDYFLFFPSQVGVLDRLLAVLQLELIVPHNLISPLDLLLSRRRVRSLGTVVKCSKVTNSSLEA